MVQSSIFLRNFLRYLRHPASTRFLHKDGLSGEVRTQRMRIGMLIACGLVAGSALMDVVLALSFSMLNGPDALRLVSEHWNNAGLFLGVVTMLILALWMKQRICFQGPEK